MIEKNKETVVCKYPRKNKNLCLLLIIQIQEIQII